MTPREAHDKARDEIAEADEGCSVDNALIRFAERILEHYDAKLYEMARDTGLTWRAVDSLRVYIEEDPEF